MNTLYDLLGALPSDDAEGLRVAFRKAVKGAHPDIHPDDPDAAMKFREIVRANEILIDDEQRKTYDHLLVLAHQESSKQAVAARVYKAASAVVAIAAVSVVTAVGYLVFAQMPAASLAPAKQIEAAVRALALTALAGPTASPDAIYENTSFVRSESENVEAAHEAAAPGADALGPDAPGPAETVPAPNAGQTRDPRTLRAQGAYAYRSGDLDGALAALDRAIGLDPKFLDAYIDRGIVLYRLQKFDRAYADISRAKRIERAGRPNGAPLTATKPRFNRAAIVPSMPMPMPPPPWHAPMRDRFERVTTAGP